MGFRFRVKLLPGVRVTLGAAGTRVSIGTRGLTTSFGKRGVTTTVGIPGAGVSFTSNSSKTREQFKASLTARRAAPRARRSQRLGHLHGIGGALPVEPRRIAAVVQTPLTCRVCDYERRPADPGPLGRCPACRVVFSDLARPTSRRPSIAHRRARRVFLGLVVVAAAAGVLLTVLGTPS